MMRSFKKLEAVCHSTFVDFRVITVKQPDCQVKMLTNVIVSREDVTLATATLAGEYTEAQAKQEYLKLIDGRLTDEAKKAWKKNEVIGPKETETHSGIYLGDVLVAEASINGYLQPSDALEDFQINRKEWDLKKPGAAMARALGLIPKEEEVEAHA